MTEQETKLLEDYQRFLVEFDGSDPVDVFAKFADWCEKPCPLSLVEDSLFTRKLSALTYWFVTHKREVDHLRGEQSRLARKINNYRATIDQMIERMGALQSSQRNKASQVARLNNTIAELDGELERRKVEIESLREALEVARGDE